MRRVPSPTGLIALAAIGVALVSASRSVWPEVRGRFAEARRARRESLREARLRAFGPWAAGVDAIAAALPPDAEFLAVEAVPTGTHAFVSADLLPRRARYVGETLPTAERLRAERRGRDAPPWVIATYGPTEPPRLLTREEFFLGVPLR